MVMFNTSILERHINTDVGYLMSHIARHSWFTLLSLAMWAALVLTVSTSLPPRMNSSLCPSLPTLKNISLQKVISPGMLSEVHVGLATSNCSFLRVPLAVCYSEIISVDLHVNIRIWATRAQGACLLGLHALEACPTPGVSIHKCLLPECNGTSALRNEDSMRSSFKGEKAADASRHIKYPYQQDGAALPPLGKLMKISVKIWSQNLHIT